jgi:hypothetical protein
MQASSTAHASSRHRKVWERKTAHSFLPTFSIRIHLPAVFLSYHGPIPKNKPPPFLPPVFPSGKRSCAKRAKMLCW